MKTRFLVIGLLIWAFFIFGSAFAVNKALAASGKFSWIPNDDGGVTKGYEIHWGVVPGEYTTVSPVGMPSVNIDDGRMYHSIYYLPEGVTVYFAALAYDDEGAVKEVSDFTPEISHFFPLSGTEQPEPAQSFKFEGQVMGIITPIVE